VLTGRTVLELTAAASGCRCWIVDETAGAALVVVVVVVTVVVVTELVLRCSTAAPQPAVATAASSTLRKMTKPARFIFALVSGSMSSFPA
jgi:hypothetical protein